MQDQLFNAGTVNITHRRARIFPSEGGLCREPGCESRARAKQGARYCEEHARFNGYNPLSGTEQTLCGRCSATYRRTHRSIRQTEPVRAWHDFCPECRERSAITLSQLRIHRVNYDQAVAWLEQSGSLQCDLCQRKLHRKSGDGRAIIDHDHKCCPRGASCGVCIRGVLCNRCNTQVGAYENLFSRFDLERLTEYLSSHF